MKEQTPFIHKKYSCYASNKNYIYSDFIMKKFEETMRFTLERKCISQHGMPFAFNFFVLAIMRVIMHRHEYFENIKSHDLKLGIAKTTESFLNHTINVGNKI